MTRAAEKVMEINKGPKNLKDQDLEDQNFASQLAVSTSVEDFAGFNPQILAQPEEAQEKRPRKAAQLYLIPKETEETLDALLTERGAIEGRNLREFEEKNLRKVETKKANPSSFYKRYSKIYERHAAELSPDEFVQLVKDVYDKGLIAGMTGQCTEEDRRKASQEFQERMLREVKETAYNRAYARVVEKCFKVIKKVLCDEFKAYVERYNEEQKKNRMPNEYLENNTASLCKNYLGIKKINVIPNRTFENAICDVLESEEDAYKEHILERGNFKAYVMEMLVKVRTAYAEAIERAKARLDSIANVGGEHEKKAPLSSYLVKEAVA